MIRFTFIIQILLIINPCVYGQFQLVDTIQAHNHEVYTIDAQRRMNGEYKFYFYELLQVQGYYKTGLKTGKWIYQPDNQFKFIGYYKEDKKDSVWIYYINGKLFSTYNFSTGENRAYYPDGTLKSKGDSIGHNYQYDEYFGNGKHKRSILSASTMIHLTDWDRRGQVTEDIWFKDRLPYNINVSATDDRNYLFEGDVKDGNGSLLVKFKRLKSTKTYIGDKISIKDGNLNGDYEEFTPDGIVKTKGFYSKGYMTGKWKIFNSKTGELIKELNYSSADSLVRDSTQNIGFSSDQRNYVIAEMPMFGGYPAGIVDYIKLNLKYPKEALKEDIKGQVLARFIINSVGKVSNVKLIQSVDEQLDKEVLKLIRTLPYWRPAMQLGKAFSTAYTIPVTFRPTNW